MSHTVFTCSRQNLRNRNKEDLTESIGVVLAKCPLKVKLERISTTLVCQTWKIMRTLVCEGFGVFIVV